MNPDILQKMKLMHDNPSAEIMINPPNVASLAESITESEKASLQETYDHIMQLMQRSQKEAMRESVSPIDRMMNILEEILHDKMDIKAVWYTKDMEHMHRKTNDPDYWVGLAESAYRAKHIKQQDMIDILIGMKAYGADEEYLKTVLQRVMNS